jgi:hypothetical protein
LALAASCAFTSAASAAMSISSLTVTPSSYQAGGHPDVTIDAMFLSSGGDTLKDATVALASGLLADPSVATNCPEADFAAAKPFCPDSSQIGTGTAYADVPSLGVTRTPATIGMYKLAPVGSEIADVGVIVSFYDYPYAAVRAPIEIRTTPDVGANIPITGVPNALGGVGLQVKELSLTLDGTVDGRPFTRLPTSCSPAVTTFTFDSWNAPSTSVSGSAPITPTGCDTLAYAPQLSVAATTDSGDNGVALSASITQAASESATRSVAMTLPGGLGPRLAAIGSACASATAPGCVPIGSASVTTPLLPAPLQGSLLLVANPPGLPSIDAVFPAPFAFTLQGTPSFAGASLVATFSGLPDVPITSLQVTFGGGPNSLLVANSSLCAQSQVLNAAFTAQSGATAVLTPTMTVSGTCPAPDASGSGSVSGAGSSGSGAPSSGAASSGFGAPGSGVTLTPKALTAGTPSVKLALSSGGPSLRLTVAAGKNASGLSLVSVRFPSGVSLASRKWPHGLTAKLDGHTLPLKDISSKGGLTFKLGGKGQKLEADLTGGLVELAKRLRAKPAKAHTAPTVTFVVTVKDAAGKSSTFRVTVSAH